MAGRVSVFAGKSGVGKTSLLNRLQPGLGLRVNQVIDHGWQEGLGRHTTSHVQMFGLEMGGAVVDTPGMREFGLWERVASRQRREHGMTDLAELYVDLRPYVGTCRFGLDCSHTHEPGCAIKRAVEDGDVSLRRYRSYLALAEEGGR